MPVGGGAASVTRGARPQRFDLCGLVVHHGRALRSGHYTAYAASWQSASAARWLHYNDNIVKPVELDEVAAQQSGAYILFYVRR